MHDWAVYALWGGGVLTLGFAVLHLFFWRLFRWKEDLASLTSLNRAVMQILNLCLTFVFLVVAYVSLFHTGEMLSTGLGRALTAGLSLFWFLRAVEQVAFFGLRRPISAAFTGLFLLLGVMYGLPIL